MSRRKASALVLLLHQFQSPVVYLLSFAAALAFYFGELEEGGAIAVVLAVNALIGFLTEFKAARSIEALRALGTHSVRVRRDGHVRLVPAEEMVPGDIVVLEAGNSISADIRLVEASNLAADEFDADRRIRRRGQADAPDCSRHPPRRSRFDAVQRDRCH